MGKRYAYILDRFYGERYWTGFNSVDEAIKDARKRDRSSLSQSSTVYVVETDEYVPAVDCDRVIDELQRTVDGECEGRYKVYLEHVPDSAKKELSKLLTEAFIRWARKREIKYWVDVPMEETMRMYSLESGKVYLSSFDNPNVWLKKPVIVKKTDEAAD